MQLPGAITFVTDGILMGANDFRNLRWSTTISFVVSLPVFVAVMVQPSLGILTVWLGVLVAISRARRQEPHPRPGRHLDAERRAAL